MPANGFLKEREAGQVGGRRVYLARVGAEARGHGIEAARGVLGGVEEDDGLGPGHLREEVVPGVFPECKSIRLTAMMMTTKNDHNDDRATTTERNIKIDEKQPNQELVRLLIKEVLWEQ